MIMREMRIIWGKEMAKTKKEELDDILTALMQVGQIKACE
jgi:hypothetical protein